MRLLSIVLILFLLLCSCSNSNQYDVYVRNQTGEPLTISYKTRVDKEGPIENTIVIQADRTERIVSSIELNKGSSSATVNRKQCIEVLEYLHATIRDTKRADDKWCSEEVMFQHVDIGQGEFTVTYELSDFE